MSGNGSPKTNSYQDITLHLTPKHQYCVAGKGLLLMQIRAPMILLLSSCKRCAGGWYHTGLSMRIRLSTLSMLDPKILFQVVECGGQSKERNGASCLPKGELCDLCPILHTHAESRNNSYYEWLKKGKERIPYFTKHKDDRIMLLASLYDCTVLEGDKDPTWTFTIVTTVANKEFEWLHERQPVILSSRVAVDSWLDVSSQTWTDQLTKLVEPYHDPSTPLEWYVHIRLCVSIPNFK